MQGEIAVPDDHEPAASPADSHGARTRRSRETVLDATAVLLVERGFGGTTVDEVSRRSGVAKTTIYRHWPTRGDLLRDAGSRLHTPLSTPDTGTAGADLRELVDELARALTRADWPHVLPSVIDAAEREPAIAEMYAGLQSGFATPFVTVIERAVARGEFRPDLDVATLVAALTGPLFYRRWFSREPLDAEFLARLVDLNCRYARG
jgi:AcrR family transcriptional regulator